MNLKIFLPAVLLPVLSTTSLYGADSVSSCSSSDKIPVGDVAPADSLDTTTTLGGITVSAPKVIRKADMDVYYPPVSTVGNSQNGFALINNLMIPTLSVNELMGSVTANGQNVEIRINGRKSSVEQLKVLIPESVKRVEWIDDPGSRYGGAAAVLNVITVNPTVGGSFMAEMTPAVYRPWGNGYLDLKLNDGRSQWSVGSIGRYTNHMSTYREYSETFTRPDGLSVTRRETPVDGYVSMTNVQPYVSYSYVNPGKTNIWAGLSFNKNWPTTIMNEGLLTLSDGRPGVVLYERSSDSGTRPKANVYMEQTLGRKQSLAIDVDASVYDGRSEHVYREKNQDDDSTVTDVSTLIKERQRKISMEADYIKKFRASSLTAGASWSGLWSRLRRGSGSESRHRQQNAYFFAEYFQKIGTVNLAGGMGAQYTDVNSGGSDAGTGTWSWQPRVSAGWRIASHSKLNLTVRGHSSAPLATQRDTEKQQIDDFQYQIGNPHLKSYSTYTARLRYSYTFPRVTGVIEGRWNRSPGAIAPMMYWDDDNLVTTFENSRGRTQWEVLLSPQVEIVPGLLTVKGSLRWTHARTAGTGYIHTHRSWSGDVSLMATWRGWLLMASYEANPATLTGETINRGEKISIVMLGYHWHDFFFSTGMFMPFTNYSMGSESLNRWNSNRNTLRSHSFDRMACVRISYNLSWGKQRKGASRIIDESEDPAAAKAAGR